MVGLFYGEDVYIRERQIHYWYIAVTVVSCFILTFVIFAPGNFIRTEAATLNESQNITQKILDLVYANYYSEVSFKLVTVISIFEGVFLFRYSKFISLFAWINVTILTTFGNNILFWRNVLFSISLFDALLMNHKEYLLLGIGIYVNQYFSPQTILLLLVFVAMLSLCKSSMVKHFAWAISACIMITLNLFPTYVGYRENEIIHKKNNESIASGLHNNSDSIYILAYIDDRFGWMSPPLSEFHEGYLRKYYGITSEIVITYNKNIS